MYNWVNLKELARFRGDQLPQQPSVYMHIISFLEFISLETMGWMYGGLFAEYIDTQILFYFFYLREYRATKVNQIKLLLFVIKTKTRRRSIILGIRRVYNIFYNNAIISLKRVSG